MCVMAVEQQQRSIPKLGPLGHCGWTILQLLAAKQQSCSCLQPDASCTQSGTLLCNHRIACGSQCQPLPRFHRPCNSELLHSGTGDLSLPLLVTVLSDFSVQHLTRSQPSRGQAIPLPGRSLPAGHHPGAWSAQCCWSHHGEQRSHPGSTQQTSMSRERHCSGNCLWLQCSQPCTRLTGFGNNSPRRPAADCSSARAADCYSATRKLTTEGLDFLLPKYQAQSRANLPLLMLRGVPSPLHA